MEDASEETPDLTQALQVAPLAFTRSHCVLALTGRLTHETAPDLEQAAADAAEALQLRKRIPDRIVIDLSGVSYIDARGLRALAVCARTVHIARKARNPDFVAFRGAQGQALRILTENHFDLLYPLLSEQDVDRS